MSWDLYLNFLAAMFDIVCPLGINLGGNHNRSERGLGNVIPHWIEGHSTLEDGKVTKENTQ